MSVELKNLTEEELVLFQQLLNKINPSGVQAEVQAEQPKKKKGRPKKVKIVEEEQPEEEIEDEDEPVRLRRNKNVKRVAKSPKKQSNACRTRPIIANPGKKNKFLTSGLFNEHKEDTKLDRKLWKNRKPSERRPDDGLVEMECDLCGDVVRVHPTLILRADKDKNYVCDHCVARK